MSLTADGLVDFQTFCARLENDRTHSAREKEQKLVGHPTIDKTDGTKRMSFVWGAWSRQDSVPTHRLRKKTSVTRNNWNRGSMQDKLRYSCCFKVLSTYLRARRKQSALALLLSVREHSCTFAYSCPCV